MEEDRREYLLRKAVEGDRARITLEVLEGYQEAKDKDALAALASVKTPEEAFKLACAHQAYAWVFGELKTAVSVGRHAAKELMEEI